MPRKSLTRIADRRICGLKSQDPPRRTRELPSLFVQAAPLAFRLSGLDEELRKRDADPWCGLQIVDLASGDIVEWIRLEGGVTELFDVCVLPGVRRPTATGFLNDEVHRLVTIEPTTPG